MRPENPEGEGDQKPEETDKIAGVRAQIEAEIARRKEAQGERREPSAEQDRIPNKSLPNEPDRDGEMIVREAAALQSIQKLGEHADKVIERVCDPSSGKTYILLSARTGKKDALILEAEAYKKLHGVPGIPKVVSMDLEADDPHILLEDMELRPALEPSELRTLALNRRVGLAGKILTVMAAIHQRGLLHRDLKPEHFMIGNDGELYVIDFSMSGATTESTTSVVEPSIPSLAEGRQVHGKEYHRLAALRITPEEINGRPYSEQAEIFVLGNFLALVIAGEIVQTEAGLNEAASDETLDHRTLKRIKEVIHRMRERNLNLRYKKLEDVEKDWAEAFTPKIPEAETDASGEHSTSSISAENLDPENDEKAIANTVLEVLRGLHGEGNAVPGRNTVDQAEELLLRPSTNPEIWRDAWAEYFSQRTSLTPGRENAEMGMLIELVGLEFELPMARDHQGNGAEHTRRLLINNLLFIQESHIMRLGIRERMIGVLDLEDKDLSAKSGRKMTVPRAFVNTDAMEIFFDVIADNRINKDQPKVKAAFREIYGLIQALANIKVPLGTDMKSCMMGFERMLAQHPWSDAELNGLFPISSLITEGDYLRSVLAKCLPPARLAKLANDSLVPLSVVLRLVPEIVWRDGDLKVRRDFITAVQNIHFASEITGQPMTEGRKTVFNACWEKARERATEKIEALTSAEEDITEAVNVLRECCGFRNSDNNTRSFGLELRKLIDRYPDQLTKWAVSDTDPSSQSLILEAIEENVLNEGGMFTWNPLKWNLKTFGRQFSFFSKRFGSALKAIAVELDRRMQFRKQSQVKIPRDHARFINIREMIAAEEILHGLHGIARMVKKERENPPDPGNENLLIVEDILRKNGIQF